MVFTKVEGSVIDTGSEVRKIREILGNIVCSSDFLGLRTGFGDFKEIYYSIPTLSGAVS
jgi:hypothetical protein